MATEALFLTRLVNAIKHQKVATVDIPAVLMQSNMEGETVHIKLEGKMAELLIKLNPKLYQKYVRNEKGKIPIWHAPGSAPVLAKFDVKTTGVRV